MEDLARAATEMMAVVLADRPSVALMERALPAGLARGAAIPGAEALPVLAGLASALADEADRFSAPLPLFKLLIALRQLPAEVYGSADMRSPSELVATRGASRTAGDIDFDEASHVTLTEEDLPDLLRHVEISGAYASLRVLMRHASEGVPVVFPAGAPPAALHHRRSEVAPGVAEPDPQFQFLAVLPSEGGFRIGMMPMPRPERPQLLTFVAASYALLALPASLDPAFEEGVRRLGLAVLRRETAALYLAEFPQSELAGQLETWLPQGDPHWRPGEVVAALKDWGDFEAGIRGPIWLNAGPESVVIDYVPLTAAIRRLARHTGGSVRPAKV